MHASARRRVVSTCFVLWSAAIAAAQTPFASDDGPSPWFAGEPYGLGDVDADGDLDLYLLGGDGFLVNDGHGRFTPAVRAVVPPLVFTSTPRVDLADFDVDGRTDAVVAGTVYLTAGAFGLTAALTPNFGTSHVVVGQTVGDFDGDGAPDLMIFGRFVFPFTMGASAPVPPLVYLSLGGVLTPQPGALGLPAIDPMRAIDVDSDGDADLVSPTGTILPNLGGAFGPAIPAIGVPAVGNDGWTFSGVLRGDADAWLELLVRTGGQLHLFRGGPGGFVHQGSVPAAVGAAFHAAPVDVDLDGVDEVATLGFDGAARVYAVTPTGFGAEIFSTLLRQGRWFHGDLDGDGDVDLAVDDDVILQGVVAGVSLPGRALTVLFNDGLGALRPHAGALPPYGFGDLAAEDFDADGDVDLAGFASLTNGLAFTLAVNDGAGRFSWTRPASPAAPWGTDPRFTTLDVDQDGDRDVLLAHRQPGPGFAPLFHFAAVRNDGAAGWTAGPFLFFDWSMQNVLRGADLDADGFDDLLTASDVFGVQVRRGLGGGAFAAPTSAGGPSKAADALVADFDLDGDLDLAIAAMPGGGSTTLLLQQGGGVFAPDPTFPTAAASFVTAVDVDQDGLLEVYLDRKLYMRNAGGAWVLIGEAALTAPTPSGGSFPAAAASFDFEGDGDVDTFVGDGGIFVATGPGTVAISLVPAPTGRPVPVDVDRDGDLDVLCKSRLFLNRSRQLAQRMPLRPGRPTSFLMHGAPSGAWFLWASLGFAPTPLPPFGTLMLDLPTALPLASGAFDAAGAADAASGLPASAAPLVGIDVVLQGAVDTLAGPRLTNARRAKIEGF